jgi:hypothetical protein
VNQESLDKMQTTISGGDRVGIRLGHSHSAPADLCKHFDLNIFPPKARVQTQISPQKSVTGTGGSPASQPAWWLQILPAAKRVQILLHISRHPAPRETIGGPLGLNRNKMMALSSLLASKLSGDLLPG